MLHKATLIFPPLFILPQTLYKLSPGEHHCPRSQYVKNLLINNYKLLHDNWSLAISTQSVLKLFFKIITLGQQLKNYPSIDLTSLNHIHNKVSAYTKNRTDNEEGKEN